LASNAEDRIQALIQHRPVRGEISAPASFLSAMTLNLSSFQRLLHSPAVQGCCFAGLMLASAAAGFRMGSPQGSLSLGKMQLRGLGLAQSPAIQGGSSQSNVGVSQGGSYTPAAAESDPPSSTAPHAEVSSGTTLSNFAVEASSSAAGPYIPGTPNAQPAIAAAASSPAPVEIKIPLVFSNVNLAALNLTNQEVAGIDRLRTSFSKAVGQHNPNDPQYAERWADAQPTADDKLRALLGWGRFNSYLLQATRAR
jgi:hypothetical protein